MKIYRREESNKKNKKSYTQKNIRYKIKKNIHNNNKVKNLYTGINIHPTQTHMLAEPFDSLVRMK